jgi:hypothetical protein
MAEVSLNLSGVWQGRYSYPSNRPAVPFTATLSEIDSWLSGAIEEKGTSRDSIGLTLTATVQGRRTGRSVTWLKLYDGALRTYDAVNYQGEINEDATEISGRWSIPGNWSGTFLMIRPMAAPTRSAVTISERA